MQNGLRSRCRTFRPAAFCRREDRTPGGYGGCAGGKPPQGTPSPDDCAYRPTDMSTQRSGFVTLVGRPNSGKSTLLNLLVGEKISIVTDKPQTTRNVIRGIVSRSEGQIVLLDTPGIHKPIHSMNSLMMKAVRDAMSDVHVLALIVDVLQPFGRGDRFALDLIAPIHVAKVLVLNKIDRIRKPELLPMIEHYSKLGKFEEIVPISALKGENVETLVNALFKLL